MVSDPGRSDQNDFFFDVQAWLDDRIDAQKGGERTNLLVADTRTIAAYETTFALVLTGATFTITLPDAADAPGMLVRFHVLGSASTVTVVTDGGEDIGPYADTELTLDHDGQTVSLFAMQNSATPTYAWALLSEAPARVRETSSTENLNAWDEVVVVDTTGGDRTVTMTSDSVSGRLMVKKKVAGNTLTVGVPSGVQVDDLGDGVDFTLSAANEAVILVTSGDGSQWWRVGEYS